MGGFAFKSETTSGFRILPSGKDAVYVNAEGLRVLAETHPNAIPDLSAAEIMDKSKANGLAKTLVCLQAAWFCLQCIGRLAHGLPIALLELTTFAHALCALIMFVCWARKPLDVEEPTFISDDSTTPLFAAFCFTSRLRVRWDIYLPQASESESESSAENYQRHPSWGATLQCR